MFEVSHTQSTSFFFLFFFSQAVYMGSYCCVCAQSCLTLWDPMDCSPSDSSAHGILQARILEWVAIFSSRGSSQSRDPIHVSCISCIGRWILYHCTTWEVLWHTGSKFPNQGSNLYPLEWKCRVLATGPPGRSCSLVLVSSWLGVSNVDILHMSIDSWHQKLSMLTFLLVIESFC